MARSSEPVGSQACPRVLLACDWFVKYTAGLARGFAEGGCDVMLLTRDHANEFPSETGEDVVGRYVQETVGDGVKHRMLGGRVRDTAALPALASLRREVGVFKPDYVHVQESVLDDLRLLIAAGARPGRYAVTFHDPTPHPGDRLPGLRRRVTERRLLRHAGLIFVHSEVDRAELRVAFDTHAPIEVVPHGTGSPDITPVPPDPVLLFFGRILPYKGLDVLLDALPDIWASVPSARLVIAGTGDVPAHRLLFDPRVELRDQHVPEGDVRDLFRSARCVVLPYKQASQSGVGSQAKVYGRPMVVTAVGGLPELVADGSGLVVEPEDAAALARTVVEVLATPGLADSLGERAAAGGRASDWPEVGRESLDAYRRHLGGTRTPFP